MAEHGFQWVREIRQSSKEVPIILLALKTDLRDESKSSEGFGSFEGTSQHCVTSEEVRHGTRRVEFSNPLNLQTDQPKGRAAANTIDAHKYMECSSKSFRGVMEAIEAAATLASSA